jgi:hypothetical protein
MSIHNDGCTSDRVTRRSPGRGKRVNVEADACRWCGHPIVQRHCKDNPQCDWCQPCVNKKIEECRPA